MYADKWGEIDANINLTESNVGTLNSGATCPCPSSLLPDLPGHSWETRQKGRKKKEKVKKGNE